MSQRNYKTHTIRTLQRVGWYACDVERFFPHPPRRYDAFGFADVAAFTPGKEGTLWVQACARHGISSHHAKITTEGLYEVVRDCLLAGNRVELWGWQARKRWPSVVLAYSVSRNVLFEIRGDFSVSFVA